MKTKFVRHPKGKLNAIRNNARPGAVPPDAWEDNPIEKTNQVWKYVMRLFGVRSWRDKILHRPRLETFCKKVRAKFPTYKEHEIKCMYYTMVQYQSNPRTSN